MRICQQIKQSAYLSKSIEVTAPFLYRISIN